jgi:hypothetical protein
MSHICANDEYLSQVGATNRPENIVIRYVSFVSLTAICIARSNEILGWEGVENRQLLCFFKA